MGEIISIVGFAGFGVGSGAGSGVVAGFSGSALGWGLGFSSTGGFPVAGFSASSFLGSAFGFSVSSGGTIENVELLNGQWEEASFCGVESVAGSEADIYVSESATGEMVSLGDGQYLQLMYQAPKSGTQASLGISVVQIAQGTEKIYSVFGQEGESVTKQEGLQFGGYYNALGKQIFLKETEENEDLDPLIETEEPVEVEETEIPEETVLPEETIIPEETPEAEEFSTEQP